jgi:hypothetical protein
MSQGRKSSPPIFVGLSRAAGPGQPVAEIVQCGEPIFSRSYGRRVFRRIFTLPFFVPVSRGFSLVMEGTRMLARWRSRFILISSQPIRAQRDLVGAGRDSVFARGFAGPAASKPFPFKRSINPFVGHRLPGCETSSLKNDCFKKFEDSRLNTAVTKSSFRSESIVCRNINCRNKNGLCRFSEGRDPTFSKPFPPELFPRLSALSLP